ncbi:MAG: hypothetical protein U1E05_26490 [Patescibacteria group bacterium]|nr:hypothetical protein [Patescibacteria group bacterium]
MSDTMPISPSGTTMSDGSKAQLIPVAKSAGFGADEAATARMLACTSASVRAKPTADSAKHAAPRRTSNRDLRVLRDGLPELGEV